MAVKAKSTKVTDEKPVEKAVEKRKDKRSLKTELRKKKDDIVVKFKYSNISVKEYSSLSTSVICKE